MAVLLRCAYCGIQRSDLQRDHVVPRSRGGPDAIWNIVMACPTCNSSKSDLLPSEWLEDVPERVKFIESRVNRNLEIQSRSRDRKRKKNSDGTLFVFCYREDGMVDYIGEVVETLEHEFRVNVIDAFLATGCGFWSTTGELKDLPKAKCRMFIDKITCLETALKINARKCP